MPDQRSVDERLEALDMVFDESAWLSRDAVGAARARARERALLPPGDRAVAGESALWVLRTFVSEMVSALAVELAAHPSDAAALLDRVSREVQCEAATLGRVVLRSSDLLSVSPRVAIEAQLGLLGLFAPVVGVALWTRETTGGLRCVCAVGADTAKPDMRALASRVLNLQGSRERRAVGLVAVPVERCQVPIAALVGRPTAGGEGRAEALLGDAAPALSAAIERHSLLSRNADAERAMIAAGERRMTLLGLDLHDGPLQDIALLAEDLRMFRQQLAERLAGDTRNLRLLGRVDDLEARLEAVDAELRRVATSLQSPFLLDQPFPVALQHVLDAFERRAGVRPRLLMSGDVSSTSASQQMALLAVVRESLSNAREHSGAARVKVTVSSQANGMQVRIEDDGRGFEVEPTLVRAARDGRLGLVGIHERIRLLGGHSEIASRPGGPTVVSATLPHWQPVDGENPIMAVSPAEAEASARRGP